MATISSSQSPAPTPAAPKQPSPQKKASAKPKVPKPKTAGSHPPYGEMIVKAIGTLKERNGSSKVAISKYICSNYNVGNEQKKVNANLKASLKRLVGSGVLKQAKGIGASGSFRLGEGKKPTSVKTTKMVKAPKTKDGSPKKAKSTPMPKVKGAKKSALKKKAPAAVVLAVETPTSAATTSTPSKPSQKKAVPAKPKKSQVVAKVTKAPAKKAPAKSKAKKVPSKAKVAAPSAK